jgi:hypothetical protein
MFTNPTYSQVSDDFLENEGYNKETIKRVSVINICGFLGWMIMAPFLMIMLTLMRHMDHPPPWSGPYLGYETQ